MDSNDPGCAWVVAGAAGALMLLALQALRPPTQPTQPRVVCPSVREAVEATVAAHAQATASAYGTRDAAWADRAATQDAGR